MLRVPKYETPETPPKRERLTVTQLAGYDDILTDALVDHVRMLLLSSTLHGFKQPSANGPHRCTSGLQYGRTDRSIT